jgi:hypothetical protein
MSTPAAQTASNLPELDAVLADSTLLDPPRALLLLRICQSAQLLAPEVLGRYWPQLLVLADKLPAAHRDAFEALQSKAEPSSAYRRGLDRRVADRIVAGTRLIGTNSGEACDIFRQCDVQLSHRWWWPFGRSRLRRHLLRAWAEADRHAALVRIGRVSRHVQIQLLTRWNQDRPLMPAEWALLPRKRLIAAVSAALDHDHAVVRLDDDNATAIADALRREIHLVCANPTESERVKVRRNQALGRYVRLVRCVAAESSARAEQLMESAFGATATTACYGDAWMDRFDALRTLIVHWAALPALHVAATPFLDRQPQDVRDFALAQWHAMLPSTQEECAESWRSVAAMCTDRAAAEAWFLLMLVGRDLGKEALQLASASPHSTELLTGLRRAWMCASPAAASMALGEDTTGDVVVRFLQAESPDRRAQVLREITTNGTKPLPPELWGKPDWLYERPDEPPSEEYGRHAGPNRYRTKPAEGPLRELVRSSLTYHYADIDPHLLTAFSAWDVTHPDEVRSVFASMLANMEPGYDDYYYSLYFHDSMTRCHTIFAAQPLSLKIFADWVKQHFVESVTHVCAGVIALSLRSQAPFLYCLLGAQRVAGISPTKCDDILKLALAEYTADEDLMIAAAELFASDKGLSALPWPGPPKSRVSLLKEWQLGVVQAASKQIAASVSAHLASIVEAGPCATPSPTDGPHLLEPVVGGTTPRGSHVT